MGISSTPPELLLAQDFILYGVMPVWIAAGFADWLCHRRSAIERTSGTTESALHLVMIATLGIPTLAAAFFEINAVTVALMLGGFTLHELVFYIDLRWSSARRDIPPIEQIVHSFMEFVPVIGGVLVLLIHWPAVLSLFGLGVAPPDFALRPRPEPLTREIITVYGTALTLLILAPYAEEFWRCMRTPRRPH